MIARSSVFAAATPASSPGAPLGAFWRGIPAAHFVLAATLGLAWGFANALGWWLGNGFSNAAHLIAYSSYGALLPMFLLVFGLAAADAATRAQPERLVPYALAAIAAAVLGEFLFILTAPLFGFASCNCAMDRWATGARSANMLPDSLLICGFVTAGYRYWRRTVTRVTLLNVVELEGARLTRQTQESRLQAMQACIEPQFLFDTLAEVARLHAADPRTAIRLLDDLIVYLRAALPHLKETTSTVAKECQLATAYLNIQRLSRPELPAFEIAIDADAHDANLPAMLLLPFLSHIFGTRTESIAAHDPLCIRVEIAGSMLRITIRTGANVFLHDGPGRELVGGIRDRLRSLYGSAARLEIGADGESGNSISMEFPRERTDSNPR